MQYSEPISPLVYYDPAVDKILFCAEKGIPLINFPAPQGGSTAPATFAGEMVQGSAESLSGLVPGPAARPGRPLHLRRVRHHHGHAHHHLLLRRAEMSLMVGAMAQMAQRYRLPFFGTAGCSDAKFPDAQAAAEAAFSCLASAPVGANLIHDAGSWLDHGSLALPAFMVLVNEILSMVNQYMGGMPMNDETLAVGVMVRIGPGGHYLNEEHTLRHYKEMWYSDLFDRTIYQTWLDRGGKRFDERLRNKTAKLMEHQPKSLPEDVGRECLTTTRHWQ